MGMKVATVNFEWTLGEVPSVSISTNSFDIGSKTMDWNYRVVLDASDEDAPEDILFTIREVFYDNDGEIMFWSDDSATPSGETFQELADDFDRMQEAFERPALKVVTNSDGEDTLEEVEVEYVYPDEDAEDETEE